MRGPETLSDSKVDTAVRGKQQIMFHDDAGGDCRMRWRLAGFILAVAALAAGGALPAAALSVGERVTHHVMLGDKQVPLPAGEWVVAGLGTQPFQMPALGAYGTIETAVLFRTRGNRIDAVLEANANRIPVNDGWGRTRSCMPGKQLLVVTRYKTGWETSCAFVEATRFAAASAGPPAWEQARHFAGEAKLRCRRSG